MATYKEIGGVNIKSLTSDPSTLLQGEIWYNSTSGTIKAAEFTTGSWSAGGNLPTPMNGNSGAGIATAALSFGGGLGPPGSYTNTSNTYDGSTWTAAPTVPFTHSLGGGTGTAAAAIGGAGDGNAPGATAEFNGSTWTALPALGINGYQMHFVGSQTAAVGAGAYYSDNAWEWNNVSWTASGASMPVHKYGTSCVGTALDGAWLAGSTVGPGAQTDIVQLYNGTSWSTGTVVPTTGAPGGVCSNGSPVDDLWVAALAGSPLGTAGTYTWDSSSWTTTGNMGTGRNNVAAGGTDRYNGWAAGGHDGSGYIDSTEEFIGNVAVAKTVTTS